MNRIRTELDHRESDSHFRSLALCILGGVGKSQVALAYAHESEKGVLAVFWINSETPLDMNRSFA